MKNKNRKTKTQNRRITRKQRNKKGNNNKLRRCYYCGKPINTRPNKRTLTSLLNLGKNKKRITFLLGAGAVVHLKYINSDGEIEDAITSGKLKDVLIKNRQYLTVSTQNETEEDNQVTVGQYVFDCLEHYYGEDGGVNFETFLAVLEAIYDYVNDKTVDGKNAAYNSFNPAIFKFLEEGADEFNINEIHANRDDVDFFFNLWKHYYTIVVKQVSLYSDDINEEINVSLNESFKNYINYYLDKNYIVRIYTTNYDNLLPDIYRGSKDVFNGFNSNLDADKIYQNRKCLNYYNLHGSIYWQRQYLGPSKGYGFKYNNLYQYHTIDPLGQEVDNPGHMHIPTNTIAGYNKLQRTSTEPFSLMMHAFFRDCYESAKIVTIGYSYGDTHINKNLVNTLNSNSRKYYHITYADGDTTERKLHDFVEKKEMEHNKVRDAFGNIDFRVVPNNEFWIETENSKVYLGGFQSFLERKEWEVFN